MKNTELLSQIAWVLVMIGGINWLLIGLIDFNLVSMVFNAGSIITRLIYVLVGVSACFLIYLRIKKTTPSSGAL